MCGIVERFTDLIRDPSSNTGEAVAETQQGYENSSLKLDAVVWSNRARGQPGYILQHDKYLLSFRDVLYLYVYIYIYVWLAGMSVCMMAPSSGPFSHAVHCHGRTLTNGFPVNSLRVPCTGRVHQRPFQQPPLSAIPNPSRAYVQFFLPAICRRSIRAFRSYFDRRRRPTWEISNVRQLRRAFVIFLRLHRISHFLWEQMT